MTQSPSSVSLQGGVYVSLSLSVCLRVCLCMCLCRCRCRCVLVRVRVGVSWCACKGGKTLEAHQRALSPCPLWAHKRIHTRNHYARLFLVVKRKGEKLLGEGEWTFPQGDRAEGESMRDAAVRNLEEVVGKDAQMYFVGYSPMVLYTHARVRTHAHTHTQTRRRSHTHTHTRSVCVVGWCIRV
jgi:ADP-ribose pyrophosphatase YjhB (NUDIX family)